MAASLTVLGLVGCYRVAEVPGTELPRLDGHSPGHPAVRVQTTRGEAVDIHGDFKEARVVTGGDGWEQTESVFPPFRAVVRDGVLRYARSQADLVDVRRVEVVQRDGGRTFLILMIGGAAFLTGAVIGLSLDASTPRDEGGGSCRCTWTVTTAAAACALGFAIAIPATKYY
ncbi:MAG: hypothetical protein IT377_29890 [Polyangiaceae bacterium]|nr:hypothetical protein [Polyangiaceae bacterium]